jgi:hypothetical protein
LSIYGSLYIHYKWAQWRGGRGVPFFTSSLLFEANKLLAYKEGGKEREGKRKEVMGIGGGS